MGAPASRRIEAMAIHAGAAGIAPHAEIFAHYSGVGEDTYAGWRAREGYKAGAPIAVLQKNIPSDEWPAAHLGNAQRRLPTASFTSDAQVAATCDTRAVADAARSGLVRETCAKSNVTAVMWTRGSRSVREAAARMYGSNRRGDE